MSGPATANWKIRRVRAWPRFDENDSSPSRHHPPFRVSMSLFGPWPYAKSDLSPPHINTYASLLQALSFNAALEQRVVRLEKAAERAAPPPSDSN